jgi:hypothetical protein
MISVPKNAIEAIRDRPDIYFTNGVPTMEELVSMVMRDVSGQRQIKAELVREGTFAMVSANVDWMATDRAAFEELFDRFVIPTPTVVNSFRSEVVLVAVCEGVFTQGTVGDFATGIGFEDVPGSLKERTSVAARTLIWRFIDRSPV